MRRWNILTKPLQARELRSVRYFGPISHLRENMLSYYEPPQKGWTDREVGTVHEALSRVKGAYLYCRSSDMTTVTSFGHRPIPVDHPSQVFWQVFIIAAKERSFEGQEGLEGVTSEIALLDLHPAAHIASTASIGQAAFKVVQPMNQAERLAPCVGGVHIGADASIGACTCIDAGIFGEWTEIRAGAHLDNLVHVGHSAIIHSGAKVVAGSVIGGWAEIGERAWVGINASIKQHVKVGAGAVVGMGAVVLKDVPPGAVVYGNPAREKE